MMLHVEWFTGPEGDPLPMNEVVSASFLIWFGVTMLGLLVTSIFNEPLQRLSIIKRIHDALDKAKPYVPIILRVGLAIAVILQMVEHTYLAPELKTDSVWIIVLQVVVVLGLAWRKTLPVSGLALAVLYAMAIAEFGWFHALDYVFYAGIVFYLLVISTPWREWAIPALYFLTGLSLAWVGLEKMVLPQMAYKIVEEHG